MILKSQRCAEATLLKVEISQLKSIFLSHSLSENFAKDLEMFARWVEKLAE